MTLQDLGYARAEDGYFALTPKVLELGTAYVSSLGLWDVARPHLRDLVSVTGESSSMSQLDGPDIVYVARVAVPKLIALRVDIGTRFPAPPTSQGKALLAWQDRDQVAARLTETSRSSVVPVGRWEQEAFFAELDQVREQGWALADEELALGIRSIAVPVRDDSGQVRAAMNTTVHAAETSVETLVGEHLPRLQRAAAAVQDDWARWQALPSDSMEAADRDGGLPKAQRATEG